MPTLWQRIRSITLAASLQTSTTLVPDEALKYMQQKGVKDSFSYKDVWAEEHALAFTVAKSSGFDITKDIKSALEQSIAKGETLTQFKQNIVPTLQQKGWWGKKAVINPLTGEKVNAQLGSDRRLKVIYQTNIRQAYAVAQNTAGLESITYPYILYRIGNSKNHREEHASWDGTLLPKDDPFWLTHTPINAYGCNCYVRYVSESGKQRLLKEGVPDLVETQGNKTVLKPVNTRTPKVIYEPYTNEVRGVSGKVPAGVSPGFDWNPARFGRSIPLGSDAWQKAMAFVDGNASYNSLKQLVLAQQVQEGWGTFVAKSMADNKYSRMYTLGYMGDEIATANKMVSNKISNGTVAIESRLVEGTKAIRHTSAGNALTPEQWHLLPELFAKPEAIFIDNDNKDNLIYLLSVPDDKDSLIKVTVNPNHALKTSVGYVEVVSVFRVKNDMNNYIKGNYRRVK